MADELRAVRGSLPRTAYVVHRTDVVVLRCDIRLR